MIELSGPQIAGLAPLLSVPLYHVPIVHALLEGHSSGRAWVDRAGRPSLALLSVQEAYIYLAGDAAPGGRPALLDLLGGLAQEQEVVVFACSPQWRRGLHALGTAGGALRLVRHVFAFQPERFPGSRAWAGRLPDGLTLRRADEEMVRRTGAAGTWSSAAEFARHGLGVWVLEGERMVSECTSVYRGGDRVEISVRTAEPYRNRGLATLAAATMIEDCLARGLTPNWGCWPGREASMAVAQKLGFERLPDVPALLWPTPVLQGATCHDER